MSFKIKFGILWIAFLFTYFAKKTGRNLKCISMYHEETISNEFISVGTLLKDFLRL
jgi:hypothetical protein